MAAKKATPKRGPTDEPWAEALGKLRDYITDAAFTHEKLDDPRIFEIFPRELHEVINNFAKDVGLRCGSVEIHDGEILPELMRCLRDDHGCEDINEVFGKARTVALGAWFDCIVDFTMAPGDRKALGSEPLDATYRGLLLKNPWSILYCEGVAWYLAEGMATCGPEFLDALKKDFYNAWRRGRPTGGDPYSWVLAANWTASACPLWLMERPAILKACKTLSLGGSWTESVVKERLRKLKLVRCQYHPIVDVVTDDAGCITAFEISRKYFPSLKQTEFRVMRHNPPPIPKDLLKNPPPFMSKKPTYLEWVEKQLRKKGLYETYMDPKPSPAYRAVERTAVRYRVDN